MRYICAAARTNFLIPSRPRIDPKGYRNIAPPPPSQPPSSSVVTLAPILLPRARAPPPSSSPLPAPRPRAPPAPRHRNPSTCSPGGRHQHAGELPSTPVAAAFAYPFPLSLRSYWGVARPPQCAGRVCPVRLSISIRSSHSQTTAFWLAPILAPHWGWLAGWGNSVIAAVECSKGRTLLP